MQKKSHELAYKHLVERFSFEIEINKEIFGDKNISLENLINDYHSKEIFSEQEYQKAFKEAQKNAMNNLFLKNRK